MASQVILLFVAVGKHLIKLPLEHIQPFSRRYLDYVQLHHPEVYADIARTGELHETSAQQLKDAVRKLLPLYCAQNGIEIQPEEDD